MNSQKIILSEGGLPKLGCPENWAFLPFLKEMKRLKGKLEVTEADNITLNSLLESKVVNCAFLPSIELYNDEELEMALPVGLSSSNGWTVFWGSKKIHQNYWHILRRDLLSFLQLQWLLGL